MVFDTCLALQSRREPLDGSDVGRCVAALQDSADRTSELAETGCRSRNRVDPENDIVVVEVMQDETLDSLFWVPGQGRICESVSAVGIVNLGDAAREQQPQTERASAQRHGRADRQGHASHRDPGALVHAPSVERGRTGGERIRATADDSFAIELVEVAVCGIRRIEVNRELGEARHIRCRRSGERDHLT